MDEMRKLYRILRALFPLSCLSIFADIDDTCSNNRLTVEQLQQFFLELLGDNPEIQPVWGLPGGWSTYVSTVLSWCVSREITPEQVKTFVVRRSGCPYKRNDRAVYDHQLFLDKWKTPLCQVQIASVQASTLAEVMSRKESARVAINVVAVPQATRSDSGSGVTNTRDALLLTPAVTRTPVTTVGKPAKLASCNAAVDIERMSEVQLWKMADRIITAAHMKRGTTLSDIELEDVIGSKKRIKLIVNQNIMLPQLPPLFVQAQLPQLPQIPPLFVQPQQPQPQPQLPPLFVQPHQSSSVVPSMPLFMQPHQSSSVVHFMQLLQQPSSVVPASMPLFMPPLGSHGA